MRMFVEVFTEVLWGLSVDTGVCKNPNLILKREGCGEPVEPPSSRS